MAGTDQGGIVSLFRPLLLCLHAIWKELRPDRGGGSRVMINPFASPGFFLLCRVNYRRFFDSRRDCLAVET